MVDLMARGRPHTHDPRLTGGRRRGGGGGGLGVPAGFVGGGISGAGGSCFHAPGALTAHYSKPSPGFSSSECLNSVPSAFIDVRRARSSRGLSRGAERGGGPLVVHATLESEREGRRRSCPTGSRAHRRRRRVRHASLWCTQGRAVSTLRRAGQTLRR